jgi:hypothetical protein
MTIYHDEKKNPYCHNAIVISILYIYIYIIRHKSKHKYDRNLEETNLKF